MSRPKIKIDTGKDKRHISSDWWRGSALPHKVLVGMAWRASLGLMGSMLFCTNKSNLSKFNTS